jgi:hypothetical protein
MGMLDRFLGPPSRDKFASTVMAGIQRAGERRRIVYDSDQFCLRPDGDEVSVMNLTNLYTEFCATSKDLRPKLITNVVRNWFADRRPLPEAYEDVHPDLLPTVRSRAYFEFASLQMQAEGGRGLIDYPHQVLADHLSIGLVYDLPESMRTIVAGDLEGWDVSFYEALEAACANLRQKEDPVFLSPRDGVYFSATGDNYDASRLILLDMMRQFDVRGDIVAMIPNRDTLIITGTDDAVGLKIMADRAEQAMKEPRPISTVAFRLENEEWSPWLPPQGHVAYSALAMLRLQSIGQEYAEQKNLLEAVRGSEGGKPFIATFSALQSKQTDELHSYCIWTDGVDTMLPRTDLVHLVRLGRGSDEGKLIVSCEWNQLASACGRLLEPQDIYPPRFLVREFPSAAQLDELISQKGNR